MKYLVLVPGFLSLALEGHVASGRVKAAADEHSLAGALAGRVVCHLVVQLVGPQHVATLAIKTEIDS
jgi:stage V sporulation protein SpoVS